MKGPRNAIIAQKKPSSETLKARKASTKPAVEKDSKKKKKNGNDNDNKTKDPDAPKRPPSAFFVFMVEFRKYFKEKYPDNKAISAVGKAGGEKWKSLSDSEKAPYTEIALKKKAEYEKAVEAYKKQKINNNGRHEKSEAESEKSSCEVNNEEEQEASS